MPPAPAGESGAAPPRRDRPWASAVWRRRRPTPQDPAGVAASGGQRGRAAEAPEGGASPHRRARCSGLAGRSVCRAPGAGGARGSPRRPRPACAAFCLACASARPRAERHGATPGIPACARPTQRQAREEQSLGTPAPVALRPLTAVAPSGPAPPALACHTLQRPRASGRARRGPLGARLEQAARGRAGPDPQAVSPWRRRACSRRRWAGTPIGGETVTAGRGWRLPRALGRTRAVTTRDAPARWQRRAHVPGASPRRGAPPGCCDRLQGRRGQGSARRGLASMAWRVAVDPCRHWWGRETRRTGPARAPGGHHVATALACCAGVAPLRCATPAGCCPWVAVTPFPTSPVAKHAWVRQALPGMPLPPPPPAVLHRHETRLEPTHHRRGVGACGWPARPFVVRATAPAGVAPAGLCLGSCSGVPGARGMPDPRRGRPPAGAWRAVAAGAQPLPPPSRLACASSRLPSPASLSAHLPGSLALAGDRRHYPVPRADRGGGEAPPGHR